jgi:hypothetical protein
MIPRIFVSSTIKDLQHVRDAIRELIAELGYQPAMSEHGEIGYLPEVSAADACYREAQDCDFGILIIGKRYGDDHRNNISVTHNEYRTLAGKVPLITVVEKDVLSYRAVFKANPKSPPATFPGMDHPEKTFGFLDEVSNSPRNNGISEFKHIGEARTFVRLQLAHLFGNLLRNTYDPLKGEVKDILAEVRSLRSELIKGDQQLQAIKYLRVSRVLLEDNQDHYRTLLERMFGNADQPVKAILDYKSFDELIAHSGWKMSVVPALNEIRNECEKLRKAGKLLFSSEWTWTKSNPRTESKEAHWFAGFAIIAEKHILITESAVEFFQKNHLACRAAAEG